MTDAIGRPIRRKEDERFLTGRGRFVDDIVLPGQHHAVFLRSPHAHARILRIDVGNAGAMPGVAVLTGADMAADGIGSPRCDWLVTGRGRRPMVEPPHPPLAIDRVRHVGDPVAMIVAETRAQALDALERIEVAYEPLPAVASLETAVAEGAALVWPEAPGNFCYDWDIGDERAVEAAFVGARIVRLELTQNRVAPAPIETRACIGEYDAASRRYTLHTTTQVPHLVRHMLAHHTLKVPEDRIRVVAPDVGGGFGVKAYHYGEEVAVLWAARRLGRPVRWTADRGEAFLSDTYGRDHRTIAELAVGADGEFLALRVRTDANLGAYLSTFASAIPTFFYAGSLPGPYVIPAIYARVRAVFTHTTPVDAYRGAGRPEATYLLERLADRAAAEFGLEPAALRRRNLVPAAAMPYRTPLLWTYDTGDFAAALEKALAAADHAGFPSRREAARARGRYRGIGIASYLEPAGMGPSKLVTAHGCRSGQFETAEIRVDGSGGVTVLTGSHSHGQGHETVFAQLAAERLGIPLGRIDVVHGDTDLVAEGVGTYASRSLVVGGAAISIAADRIVAKAKAVAARLLEADEIDIELEAGRFRIKGTDRVIGWGEIAAAADLRETERFDPPDFTFPHGCHVCEVEVDIETGHVAVVGYWAVDDVGRQINPMIVEGQIHGGIAQGIGQALMEACRYDSKGQLLTGSLMDYCLPRAADLPAFVIGHLETPATSNPLGAKGCGEAGAIPSPAAAIGAVLDALAPLGVRAIDMPATPEAVWRAVEAARS